MKNGINKNDNATFCVRALWEQGFFKERRSLGAVSKQITDEWEHNFPAPDVSKALQRANFLIRIGGRGSFQYKQKVNPKNKKVASIEEQLFSNDLVAKLGNRFKEEINDLRFNFGRSGNCTAFLLRKILEKAIFLVFAKNTLSTKLEDASRSGHLVGLEAMLDIAAREKVNDVSILIPKTAANIKGIKFLGDTSAHNPLTNVDMETILPQMPFIVTAYKELAERL